MTMIASRFDRASAAFLRSRGWTVTPTENVAYKDVNEHITMHIYPNFKWTITEKIVVRSGFCDGVEAAVTKTKQAAEARLSVSGW